MSETVLLREFVKRRGELEHFLNQRVGCSNSASDLVQDVYVKLREKPIDSPIQNPRAYLYRIAANLATDYTRTTQRRSRILEESAESVWTTREDLNPERNALADAELAYMEKAVMSLSARQRRVFYLSRYQHLPQHEIAQSLSVGVTTVQKDLKAVMATLVAARRRFSDDEDLQTTRSVSSVADDRHIDKPRLFGAQRSLPKQ